MNRTLWLSAFALLAPSAAFAHEFWLAPSSYRAGAEDTIAVHAFVGTGFRGEPKPFATPRVVRFTLRTTKTVDLAPAALNGDLTFARFVAPDEGGALIAYQTNFADIELPAAEFDAYLALEGLEGPLAARRRLGGSAGAGRERYARCAKTWIAGSDAVRALEPASLALEIVPLADPAHSSPVRVRVLWQGKPLSGVRVRAWQQPLARGSAPTDAAARDSVGPALELRTGPDGVVKFDLKTPGEWLINAVHMQPSADRSEADWESFWASLTFARSGKTP